MDSQDQRSAVSGVIKILRRATRIAQLAPFAYLVFFIIYLFFGTFISETILEKLDAVLSVSPVTIGAFLASSKIFKLCRWHKTACLLPLSSQIEGYIDSYVITFTQEEIIIINLVIATAASLFVILAIKHFVYGR